MPFSGGYSESQVHGYSFPEEKASLIILIASGEKSLRKTLPVEVHGDNDKPLGKRDPFSMQDLYLWLLRGLNIEFDSVRFILRQTPVGRRI